MTWVLATTRFNEANLLNYKTKQLQLKWSEVKKLFTIFQQLTDNSGFGWDEEKRLPTAPDEVWDEYLTAHKDAKKFRKNPFE